MRRKAFSLTIVAVLVSLPAFSQNPRYIQNLEKLINREHEAPRGSEEENIHPDDLAIEVVLNRAGAAFEKGEASELEDCLVGGKRKVYLSLAAGGKQADHYGTSQLKFIFEKIFKEVRTRSFEFDSRDIERYNDTGGTGGIAVAAADWTYEVVADDEVVTEHLLLKLEPKESSWRIFEIRSASR